MRRSHVSVLIAVVVMLVFSAISASAALASGKPFVETKPATSVGQTEAVLNGVVNPNGAETKYYFEYGTTISYGKKTAEVAAGAGTSNLEESKAISGLTKSTTYHFRVVATNSNGTSDGSDQALTTAGEGAKCPGTVENGGVTLCSGGHEQIGTFAFTGQKEPQSVEAVFYPKRSFPEDIACGSVTLSKGSFVSYGKLEVSGLYIEYKQCEDASSSGCEVSSPGGPKTVLVDGAYEAGGPGLSAALTNTSELTLIGGGKWKRWTEFRALNTPGCGGQVFESAIKGEAKCSLPNSTVESVVHKLSCSTENLSDMGTAAVWQMTAELKLASGKAWSLQKV